MQFTNQTLRESEAENTKVLVFKSNIETGIDVETVRQYLDAHPHIIRWNVDHHDVDNVLRIETTLLSPACIESLLVSNGYFCEELPD